MRVNVLDTKGVAKIVHSGCELLHERVFGKSQFDFEILEILDGGVEDFHGHAVVISMHAILETLQNEHNVSKYIRVRTDTYEYRSNTYIYVHIRTDTYLQLDIKVVPTPERVLHQMLSPQILALPLILCLTARTSWLPKHVLTAVTFKQPSGRCVHCLLLIRSLSERKCTKVRDQVRFRARARLAGLRTIAAKRICLRLITQKSAQVYHAPSPHTVSPLQYLGILCYLVPSLEKCVITLV